MAELKPVLVAPPRVITTWEGVGFLGSGHRLGGAVSWLWRVDAEKARQVAALDTAPELPLGGDDEMPVQRIRMGGDLHAFAAARNYGEHRTPGRDHPHVMFELRHVFLGRGFFRERPGQHELGLENRPNSFDAAVQRGRHPAQHRVPDLPLHIDENLAGIRFVPAPVQLLGRQAGDRAHCGSASVRSDCRPYWTGAWTIDNLALDCAHGRGLTDGLSRCAPCQEGTLHEGEQNRF